MSYLCVPNLQAVPVVLETTFTVNSLPLPLKLTKSVLSSKETVLVTAVELLG